MDSSTTVVFFSLFRTDSPYSSVSLSMARELAKTNKVIYINHPYSWKDIGSGIKSGDKALWLRLGSLMQFRNHYEWPEDKFMPFLVVTPPPTLPINWLPANALHRFFQSINNGIVLRAIRKALLRQKTGEYVYINCYDPFFAGYLPKSMGALVSIYHCIDDISQNVYTAKHGLQLENKAISMADLTLVTSTKLYTLKKPFARKIATFFNAADTAIFGKVLSTTFPLPPELEGRKKPVIGFIGNLDELRIDYPLLLKIAQAYPDKTLLLVGPINSHEPTTLGLDTLPNVIFAGSRPLPELPPLLQYMDVTIIPFLKNTLTESIYPLKINEYLAAGKPVVSTSFSEDIRSFAHCAYIAEDHDQFIALIGTAIAENNPGKVSARLEVAKSNTWEVRIAALNDLLNTSFI